MTTWELQQQIHNVVKKSIFAGMTETELAGVISKVCPIWQGDLISGERSADIEGEPCERVISKGDIVLLDLQVYCANMWSDLTRVYFVGEATDKQMSAYKQVTQAIFAGEALLRPGTKGKEIWNTMRNAIGTDFAFTHHGGHLLDSKNFYLEPSFTAESEDVLQAGMIVTLEPGVYYPEEFGIRLENNYLITQSGFERLCGLSMEMSDYIVKG